MTTGLALLFFGWLALPLNLLGTLFDHLGYADLAGSAQALMQTLIERGGMLYGSAFEAFAQTPLFDLAESLANRGGEAVIGLLHAIGMAG